MPSILKWILWGLVIINLSIAASAVLGQDFTDSTDVIVSWNPNSETDLGGYIIYYGDQPGLYDHSIDVENVVQYSIRLDTAVRYYLAVTAYDTAFNESSFSREVSTIGITSVEETKLILPEYYSLHAFPNPFNPGTTISITVPEVSTGAAIRIFNVRGQQVYLYYLTQAGQIKIRWQPGSLPTGIYYVVLNNGTFLKTKRITYLK